MWGKTKSILACIALLLVMFSNTHHPALAQTAQSVKRLTWQRIDYPVLPSPRYSFAIATNPINQIALIFGGFTSYTDPFDGNDLWLTNGRQWMEFPTPNHPAGRRYASMAYDETRQEAVLFGGLNSSLQMYFNDTWIFNGIDWVEQHPGSAPSPRAGSVMVYDPVRSLTYLFGGWREDGRDYQLLNDIWAWDGQYWQPLAPTVSPSSRNDACLVFDPVHKNSVLFGGYSYAAPLSDTWIWDGSQWTMQHPLHSPSDFFYDCAMAFDESSGQVIMVGTDDAYYNPVHEVQTWAWDGQDWSKLSTVQTLPEQVAYNSEMAYLPELKRVVVFGSYFEKNPHYTVDRFEVWALADEYLTFLPAISQ